MTVGNIIALVIGGICTLVCLALAVLGAAVFIVVMGHVKEDYNKRGPGI